MLHHDPIDEPLTITIADAVRRTGMCETRIRQLIKDGHVETRPNGNRSLILYRSLKKYILGQR